jgi:hypothetical protein
MSEAVSGLLASDWVAANKMRLAIEAHAAHDFVAAVRLSFEVLSQQPSFLPALVCFARAVQLAAEESTPEFDLKDARTALQKAVDLISAVPDPAHELARFLFAVEDDDQAALAVVEQAITSARTQLRDLLLAKAAILKDLGREAEAACATDAALAV